MSQQPYRIKHRNYVVEYDSNNGVALFEVRVITADILDAEQHGPTYGITDPNRQSIAMNTMWLWTAARREGKVPPNTSWPEFRSKCLDWRAADHPEVEVPPTPPGASTGSSLPSAPSESGASTSTDGDTPPATTNDS